MTARDWRSAGLAWTADPEHRRKLRTAGWVLCIPVVGWPALLGWRRDYVERLVDGAQPLLGEWRGRFLEILAKGAAATAVIHLWYAPIYAWLAHRSTTQDLWEHTPWRPALAVALLFPIFSTLLVPAWLAWLRFAGQDALGGGELLAVGALFATVTFAIPAGFLQVSRTRRIASAFALPANVRLIARHPRRYLEAWIGSGAMSLFGHFSGPLAPWGVAWCYLAIVYAFNEVPLGGRDATYLDRSRFETFTNAHWSRFTVHRRSLFERLSPLTSAPDTPVVVALAVGPLRIPVPTPR